MEQRHVSEALKEKKTAEASLKTSFFGSWKPDYDTAAHHFEKAGQLFKLGKSYAESRSCYVEAAKYYEAGRVLYSVGKCHEAAAHCSKELGRFQEAHSHIERAGDFYSQNGTPSTAISCYTKGAEALSSKLPKVAAELYLRAGELERDNDHPREAIKCFLGAKKIFARNKMYSDCINAVKSTRELYQQLENHPQIKKCNLSLVILHLARGDSVAAKQAIDGDVSLVADELIAAVESGDDATVKKLSAHGDVVYLDTEIARIAKFLSQDGAEMPASRTPQKVQGNSSPVFKSSGNTTASASLRSQRNELFARPNKENRDELFSRSSAQTPAKNELLSRAADVPSNNVAPQPRVPLQPHSNPFGQNEEPGETSDDTNSNPFAEADNDTETNPFAEADNDTETNPFAENNEDDEDLC